MTVKSDAKIKALIAQNFSRAAKTYDEVSILHQEIGNRLLARLDFLKLNPAFILDLGGGTGMLAQTLGMKYPKAHILNFDIAEGMLAYAKQLISPHYSNVCGDAEAIPIKSQSIEFVFSNGAFEWFLNLPHALKEIKRILKTEGLLLFSTFGPDTLKELKQSFGCINEKTSINAFFDMQSLGNMLVQNGFSEPVLDREMITLHYKSLKKLFKDLKLTGTHTIKDFTLKNSLRKSTWIKLLQNYEGYRALAGFLPATFEIIYGYAKVVQGVNLYQPEEDGIIRIPAHELPRL